MSPKNGKLCMYADLACLRWLTSIVLKQIVISKQSTADQLMADCKSLQLLEDIVRSSIAPIVSGPVSAC